MAYTPTYVIGDLSAIGADAVGTAGAAATSLLPVLVAVGAVFAGALGAKKGLEVGRGKKKRTRKRSYSYSKSGYLKGGWYNESYRHYLASKGISTKRYR